MARETSESKSDLLPIIEDLEQPPTSDVNSSSQIGTRLDQFLRKLFAWGELTRPAFYALLAILVVIVAVIFDAKV